MPPTQLEPAEVKPCTFRVRLEEPVVHVRESVVESAPAADGFACAVMVHVAPDVRFVVPQVFETIVKFVVEPRLGAAQPVVAVPPTFVSVKVTSAEVPPEIVVGKVKAVALARDQVTRAAEFTVYDVVVGGVKVRVAFTRPLSWIVPLFRSTGDATAIPSVSRSPSTTR